MDNCLSSVLGQEVELTDEFKRNYEKWLHNEVSHYRVILVVLQLGSVDLDLRCSTILLGQ